MNSELECAIEKFLETRSRSTKGGWAPVSDQDIGDMYQIIGMLIAAKFDRDADGDLPVAVELINRNTHQRSYYLPVPYSSWQKDIKDPEQARQNDDARIGVMVNNLSTATEAVQKELRSRQYDKKNLQSKKR